MKKYFIAALISLGVIGFFWSFENVRFSGLLKFGFLGSGGAIQKQASSTEQAGVSETAPPKPKTKEELFAEALEKSSDIKGVYMTSAVANDNGAAAKKIRASLIDLFKTTELNGVVIDVKEVKGPEVTPYLKPFIDELKKEGVWTIARIVVFPDSSQTKIHPDFYLKRKTGVLWKDNRGHVWMDPASPGAREYILSFAKSIIDLGFDELQFDYIRFPSDGDVKNIVYPVYNPKTPKYAVLKSFFEFLNNGLKAYKPDIILSADLFGYVATSGNDLGIGQRMEDIGNNFDYISFMLYPSHFYSGFQAPADALRGLPGVYYPYRSKKINDVVSNHPYETVYRSLLIAQDVLAGKIATSSLVNVGGIGAGKSEATSTIPLVDVRPLSHARLRPWLQDFDLGADTSRGIKYDANKIKDQILAAENAGASGWLLWNSSNVYTSEALKKE